MIAGRYCAPKWFDLTIPVGKRHRHEVEDSKSYVEANKSFIGWTRAVSVDSWQVVEFREEFPSKVVEASLDHGDNRCPAR